ncbi:hypothetical protein HRI96_01920 [Treponema parvum]|uniref:Lipoprotein n=1 Tax=Treponema parvum TaxID=138851 RepID=A0A975ICF8_9SPIR|nr:hypothetical protein [Treponema parvum]QTQ11054.1 hypothetical protein HRI96_01920 [Treponema parvum]QTQ17001.1 hypothetical protein HXT04_10010 [Treponema parvum]
MKLQRALRIKTFFCTLIPLFLSAFLSVSCKNASKETVVIWTNRSEFVPYSEVFNTQQNKIKVLIVYKANPADSLPAVKDEVPPDIVIGSLLRTERKRKQFRSLSYMFTTGEISESLFYDNLLDSCRKGDTIYQIPVSFNAPAIVFSVDNSDLIKEDYMLSPDQIQAAGALYNQKNKNNLYTKMGFAPQWYPEFLYLMAKMNSGKFAESGNSFSWNNTELNNTVNILRNWTNGANTSAADEKDFAFKYLYTPPYKQVLSKHCLFAFVTSNKLFSLSEEQLEAVDFRWIHKNNKIPVDDSMVTLGLYRRAPNKNNAEQFIKWFFTEKAQKAMLEHVREMNLNTSTFGISGGFSTLKNVNERIFPTYYLALLSNIPVGEYLEAPPVLPLRWESLKERVIIPYLYDAVNSPPGSNIRTIEERIGDWSKQFF